MKATFGALASAAILTASCSPPPSAKAPEQESRLDGLEQQLLSLNLRVRNLEADRKQRMDEAHRPPPPTKIDQEWQLVGAGAMDAAGRRFPDEARCEAAKAILRADAEKRAAEMAEQGARVIGSPAISCIPL